ncbi:hypothetical protein [Gordonia zhaorongruii]|uniref:hypothetical protein n=1 Tax=Gordonia zhaorongruii TaxID=2597659 RepID=UPI001050328D|nr:hypothetical protein [Gordonia zhaorongruii]
MAVGQQYPPLGYGPDGTPRFEYRPDTGPPGATSHVEVPAEPDGPDSAGPGVSGPPPNAPLPPENTGQRLAMGIAAVVVLVLVVAGGLALLSGGEDRDTLPPRAEPPLSQNTDDPYLPKSIEPKESVPGETGRPAPSGLEAVLTVEAAPGSTILFIDDGQVRLQHLTEDMWEQKVQGTTGALRVSVVAAPGAPASCKITVDGRVVAHQQLPADDPSGMLVCRAHG